MSAPWTLRVIWPIADPELFDREAIKLARADLPAVAARTGAVIDGDPQFSVVDCTGKSWPDTPTAVLCEVAARPTSEWVGRQVAA